MARRVGQPAVIAEVIAGILLGPSLLGRVSPAFFETLFPKSSLPGLSLISQIGWMPPPHPSSRYALRAVASPKSPAPRAQGEGS